MESPPTPSKAGTGTPNPLVGGPYEALGAGIADLIDKINAGIVPVKLLAQQQANLIDHHQALAAISSKESAEVNTLQRKLKDLTATTSATGIITAAQSTEYTNLNRALVEHEALLADHVRGTHAVRDALNDVIIAQEAISAKTTGIIAKNAKAAGDAISKTAGPIGELLKSVGSGAIKLLPKAAASVLGAAAGAVAKLAGGVIAAGSAATMVARTATQESTTYADVYGTRLGLATRAQGAFLLGISASGRAMLDVNRIQQIGSAVMRAGAFDAYSANMLMARSGLDLATAADVIGESLAGSSEFMERAGMVFGLTVEESAGLLTSFTVGMGAFSSYLPTTIAEVAKVYNRLGSISSLTGVHVSKLTSLIGQLSEATFPMGVTFNDITAQTGMAMRALKDYAEGIGKSGNQFLKTSANMEKFTTAMYSYGASLSPMQTFGYQLAAGMNAAKDPLQGIIDAASMTGFQRLGAQLEWAKANDIDAKTTTVMMMGAGLPQQYAKQMQEILQSETGAAALGVAFKGGATTEKALQSQFNLPSGMAKDILDLSNQRSLFVDPIERLIMLTQTSVKYLSVMASRADPKKTEDLGIGPDGLMSLSKQRPLGRPAKVR